MVIFKTRYRANKISIHAPAKGATIMGFKRAIDSPYFNPRSREGSDYNSRYCYCVANISIHAPAKGATVPHLSEHYRIAISIHAPAKGATPCRYRRSAVHAGFQSTLPRRERRRSGAGNCQRWDFNPRSREGSDRETLDTITFKNNFNPRSREGSDLFLYKLNCHNSISIHAPAKGATKVSAC